MVFWIAFYFVEKKLENLGLTIAAERQTLAERTYALDNLSLLKNKAPEAAGYKEKLTALLPSQDGLLSFPPYVERISGVHNVGSTFAFAGPPILSQGNQPGYIPFTLGVTGSPENIRDFLNDLESKSTRFLVNIDSVEFAASGIDYRADMKGRVYFQ